MFNWSRPRDLAHFESFGYDHATFGMNVEGVTTTPFSGRALDRGLTAVLVTAMRHGAISGLPNTAAHRAQLADAAAEGWIAAIAERAEAVTQDPEWTAEVRTMLRRRLDDWQRLRSRLPTGILGYTAGPGVTGLLQQPDEGPWTMWSVPMSLREVEPEVLLQLDAVDRSLDSAPDWTYVSSKGHS